MIIGYRSLVFVVIGKTASATIGIKVALEVAAFDPFITLPRMEPPKIRYFAEKRLSAEVPISLGAFAPGSNYVSLAKGSRVSITAIHDSRCDLVYVQDASSNVTALIWLTGDTFIAGYQDGTFVTTKISFSNVSRLSLASSNFTLMS